MQVVDDFCCSLLCVPLGVTKETYCTESTFDHNISESSIVEWHGTRTTDLLALVVVGHRP